MLLGVVSMIRFKQAVLLAVLLPLAVVGAVIALIWIGVVSGFTFMSTVIGDAANGR